MGYHKSTSNNDFVKLFVASDINIFIKILVKILEFIKEWQKCDLIKYCTIIAFLRSSFKSKRPAIIVLLYDPATD